MIKEITGHTKLLCLLGSPVSHSISPQMHNKACELLGLDYCYLAFDVTPETLPAAYEGLKTMDVQGFNLTMPLKESIIPLLDGLTEAATLAHSVNTVFKDGDSYIGHTTDGVGYMRSIEEAGFSAKGKTMTLLGAGGAASSIMVQAALDGMEEIFVFKRKNATFDKAKAFCDNISAHTSCKLTLLDLNDKELLASCIKKSQILTNATNVGMGNLEGQSLVDPELFHPDLFVSDVIYHPEETLLLQQAREYGLKTQNGLYMLLYQGAAAFETWTKQDMPTEAIKELYFH